LYGLVELGVDFFEVHYPKYEEAESCENDIDVEHNGAETDGTGDIFLGDIFPSFQNIH
jgi:hypothetical protein